MTKKINALLMSAVAILLCTMMLVVGTYALFTDEVTIHNHLQAGRLDVTLLRATATTQKLNAKGYLETDSESYKTDLDLSETSSEDLNALCIGNDEKIAPCVGTQTTFVIENNSDVAFGYWIEIVLINAYTADGVKVDDTKKTELALAKMLDISVTTDVAVEWVDDTVGYELATNDNAQATEPQPTALANGLTVKGENNDYIAAVELGKSSAFTVNVTFRDDPDNNDAFDQKVEFDIVVHAVQLTEELA